MNDRTFPRRIIVPLDGSDLATHAIPYTRTFATADTEIVFCRVVPDPTPLMELAGTSAYPIDRIRQERLQEANDYLDAVIEALGELPARLAKETAVGEPPDEILRMAETRDADLIVMTTHGRGFLGRILIGSVADRVTRGATMPVLLVHGASGGQPATIGEVRPIERIVVPLDGSERARQALPVASRLAQRIEIPIHLVTALPHRDEITPNDEPEAYDFYEGYVASIADSLEAEAHRLKPPPPAATSEVIIGPAAEEILRVLEHGDLIVMTSHGHGGMRRWWIGSVAERMIHTGTVPVMIVPTGDRTIPPS